MEDRSRDSWSAELDSHLRTLVSLHGTSDWDFIAASLNAAFASAHTTAQDCRARWNCSLDLKKPWTEQEELRMLVVHQKHQNKWSNMSLELRGRSNNSIKNRFYSIFRKVKNKIIKKDLVHESKVELLETLYMISLMELYFASYQPLPKQTGKRGKDFIFSLLKGLQPESIIRYKTELQKSGGTGVSLDRLWLELVGENFTANLEIASSTKSKKDKSILFHITDLPMCDKALRTLPLPRFVPAFHTLSLQEKISFHFEVFKNKEETSAGLWCPAGTGTPYFSPAAFSATMVQSAPTACRFEGFSDFTEKNGFFSSSPPGLNKMLLEGGQGFVTEGFTGGNLFT